MRKRRCASPIDSDLLVDYWLGELAEGDEFPVEEHLFGCDECGGQLRDLIALAEGIRELALTGAVRAVVSKAFLRRAQEQGLRVREYAVPAGSGVQCTITAGDDLLVGRMAADLSGARRVDIALCDETGTERHRLLDIPFGPAQREVIFNQSTVMARSAGKEVIVVKLLAVEESGDRLIGTYTFNHTPS